MNKIKMIALTVIAGAAMIVLTSGNPNTASAQQVGPIQRFVSQYIFAPIYLGVGNATNVISGYVFAVKGASYFNGSVTLAGPASPYARTKAQLLAITPTAVGQTYRCSDCSVAGSMAISTGTSAGNFGIVAPGTFQ